MNGEYWVAGSTFKFKTMLNVPVPASAAVGTVYSTYL